MCVIAGSSVRTAKSQDIIIDKFPVERTIKSSEVKIPSVLWVPQSMFIIDNHMITLEGSRDDSIIKVFKLPEGELVRSFGTKGRGPNELFSINGNSFKPVFGSQPAIVLDASGNGMNYYKLSDILSGKSNSYKNTPVPGVYQIPRALAFIGDSVIIGAPYDADMHLFLYDYENEIDSVFAEYPIKTDKLSLRDKRGVFGCYMAVKPDNSKLAITYNNQGKLEIYDFPSRKWNVIEYKNFPSLKKNLAMTRSNRPTNSPKDRKVFSWEIRASNKHIFIKVYDTNYLNMNTGGGAIRTFIPQIHVFTWAGEPVAKLQPDRYYKYFAIDKDGKNIYAIDDYFEDIIIKFSLEGVL
jgi:hypothetical protein